MRAAHCPPMRCLEDGGHVRENSDIHVHKDRHPHALNIGIFDNTLQCCFVLLERTCVVTALEGAQGCCKASKIQCCS